MIKTMVKLIEEAHVDVREAACEEEGLGGGQVGGRHTHTHGCLFIPTRIALPSVVDLV